MARKSVICAMKSSAIVIGAGIGGIATAIRLACKGYEVSVYDRNAYTGGKLTEIKAGAYRFDAGPSLFTLPDQVDELFRLAGENPRDHFNYERLSDTCHYFWDDGTFLPASGDPDKFAQQVEEILSVPASRISNYLKKGAFIYNTTAPVFLDQSLHKWQNFINWKTLRGVVSMPWLGIFSKLHSDNVKQTGDPKLTQLFDRYATYNGSDPFRAPGVLQSIPHLEFNTGAWYPVGGMHAISQSLTELAKRIGVRFYLSQAVDRIVVENKVAVGIEVNGNLIKADQIICNADVFPAYRNLLKDQPAPEKTLSQERSSSALIFYWGIKKQFAELDMHNIFFSNDYKEEFRLLFEGKTVSDDPTVYVNLTTKYQPNDAPEGCSNWFVMINVPGNTGQDWDTIIRRSRENILKKLSKNLKTSIADLIECEQILDPRTIESRTGSHQGSLYGSSSNSRDAAFLRHPNFSQKIKHLWFCGGSVHPGGGIPLCLKSAKIIGEMVEKG